jgi:hypothetical protein
VGVEKLIENRCFRRLIGRQRLIVAKTLGASSRNNDCQQADYDRKDPHDAHQWDSAQLHGVG